MTEVTLNLVAEMPIKSDHYHCSHDGEVQIGSLKMPVEGWRELIASDQPILGAKKNSKDYRHICRVFRFYEWYLRYVDKDPVPDIVERK